MKKNGDKQKSGKSRKKATPVAKPEAGTSKPEAIESDLFNQVINLTGIPAQTIRKELKTILDRKNIDVNSLTIEQLRVVVASYLREIMGGILDRYGKKSETPHH